MIERGAVDVDDERYMVAQSRAAPILVSPDRQISHAAQPWRRKEDVIDVLRGPVLLAITPIERRRRLAPLLFAAQLVVGTDEPEVLQGAHSVR